MSCKLAGPIPLADLTTLATQIVEGLQAHLLGKLQLDLERLFQEQEQRLLTVLSPECGPRRAESNTAAAARLVGPARRLNTGSSVPSTSSNSHTSPPRFSWSGEKHTATRTPTGENLQLEVRSPSKKSQGQWSLTASRKGHARNLESAGSGMRHVESEKRWLKLPWQSSDSGVPEPSGMRSLEEARDSELLALVPDFEARCQQPPSRGDSFGKASLKNRKEEHVLTFSMDNNSAGLPGVVWTSIFNERVSPEDEQLDKAPSPEEQASAPAVTATATEPHAGGSLSNGHTVDVAVATSASDTPAGQFTYEQIMADLRRTGDLPGRPAGAGEAGFSWSAPKHRHQPKRSQDGWAASAAGGAVPGAQRQSLAQVAHKSACSPRQRSTLTTTTTQEDSREAGPAPMVRQTTTQSLSTLSSSVSMPSFAAPLEALPRASTSDVNMELARPVLHGAADAERSLSDTRALCLNRRQELPGDRRRSLDSAIASKPEGEAAKPGSSRSSRLFGSMVSSNTKAVRLEREEELLNGTGRRSSMAQDLMDAVPMKGITRIFQARAPGSDSKLTRLRREDWLMGEGSKPSTRHRHSSRAQERVASEQMHLCLHRRRLCPKAFSSDTMAAHIKQEEELLDEMHQESKAPDQVVAPERSMEPASGTQMMRGKPGEPESDSKFPEVPTLFEEKPSPLNGSILCGCEISLAPFQGYVGQRVDSPLLLRLCGLLPWGRLRVAHQRTMQLLAASLVAVFAEQFYQGQVRIMSTADCPGGVCMHLGHLSDLVLSMSSFLGILAMRTLASLKLLGSSTALLTRFAVEQNVVQKWSCAAFWNSLYLTVLWAGSLAFRASTMPSEAGWLDVVRASSFMLTSLIFMSLVFSILHVSCIICILVDTYAMNVSKSMDPVRSIQEWDRLGALLRKVSRAVDHGLLMIQMGALAMLLCSFIDLMLHGEQKIWQFLSNILLAQSLILPVSKAAEATEMCTRLPSLINGMDFEGNDFSLERHYLVEHISYSAAGFYVGEIRLTAAIALRATYVSIIVALGVLTKLTQLAIV